MLAASLAAVEGEERRLREVCGEQGRGGICARVTGLGDIAVTVRWQTRVVRRWTGGRSGLHWRWQGYYCCAVIILANCAGHVGY